MWRLNHSGSTSKDPANILLAKKNVDGAVLVPLQRRPNVTKPISFPA